MPMSPTLLVPRDNDWTPLSESSLRAWWARDGKRNSTPAALANGENLASWIDTTGTYTLPTVGGTAPTGLTSGSAVVADPNAAGCIGLLATIPDDAAGTIGVLAKMPSTNAAGRDYDVLVSFSNESTTGIWLHCCIKRVSTILRIGFAAVNGGSFSSWHGNTNVSVDVWRRLIWTLDGSALAMYVDGTAQTVTNDTVGGVTTGQWMSTVTSLTNVYLMGRRRSSGLDELWEGPFDQACWFSSAFSASQVAQLDAYLSAQAAVL